MRKLVVLLTALVLGLLGAACSSDVGSCVSKPEAGAEVGVTPDAPAPQTDSPSPAGDVALATDAAVQNEGGGELGGGELDGGQSGDGASAEADSGLTD